MGEKVQVMILFNRGSGKEDNTHCVRGNMRKKVNAILDMFDVDTCTLKEQFEDQLNIDKVMLDI